MNGVKDENVKMTKVEASRHDRQQALKSMNRPLCSQYDVVFHSAAVSLQNIHTHTHTRKLEGVVEV